jgi:glycine cleavage system aminomethyltransferase T
VARGRELWDALWSSGRAHGLIAAGRGALSSLRIEKGYRAWAVDMTPEHSPHEAGIGFAVRRGDGDFLGRDGLGARPPATHRLACLVLGDATQVMTGGEPVFVDDAPVGYVTSADFGPSVGRSIAHAWVPAEMQEGIELTIGSFDAQLPARIAADPLFDPSGARLRS